MPIPRTRTLQNHDLVLSTRFASATTAETVRVVSPVAGFVERILFVRGGSHDSTEAITATIHGTAQSAFTLATGGAALTVDAQEIPYGSNNEIAAGGVVKLVSTGSPAETTNIGAFVVIRRL